VLSEKLAIVVDVGAAVVAEEDTQVSSAPLL